MSRPWGWKDPRNSLTLPLWLRVFPEAKVLHIVRNGVDVSRSLVTRERDSLAGKPGQRLKGALKRAGSRFLPRLGYFPPGPVKHGLAFELWAAYHEFLEVSTSGLPADRIFVLRYEDLLEAPAEQIEPLARFIGAPADREHVSSAAALVERTGRPSFLDSPQLISLYQRQRRSHFMSRFDYANLL